MSTSLSNLAAESVSSAMFVGVCLSMFMIARRRILNTCFVKHRLTTASKLLLWYEGKGNNNSNYVGRSIQYLLLSNGVLWSGLVLPTTLCVAGHEIHAHWIVKPIIFGLCFRVWVLPCVMAGVGANQVEGRVIKYIG